MGRRDRQNEKRRQRFGQIAIGLLMAFLMVASILQFGSTGSANDLVYNGQKFAIGENGFTTKLDGEQVLLQDLPLEGDASRLVVQNIFGNVFPVTVDEESRRLLGTGTYFVLAFDPEDYAIQFIELARLELARHYGNIIPAVLSPSDTYPSLSTVNCSAATPEVPVIVIASINTTTIGVNMTAEGDCINIRGDPYGLLAAKDYLILSRYGVIPDDS